MMSGELWRILVVEDDVMDAGLVQILLGQHGYLVDTAPTGARAAELVVQRRYGAMVLDWMLPDIEGTEIARRIRAAGSQLPIVMVTARASVRDLEVALESGADDFIAKPYDMRELIARLRAVLRRSGGTAEPALRAGPIVVDPRSHEIFVGRIRVDLTKIELRLLMLLMTNEGRPVPKAQLLASIWGNCTNAASNLVAVHVSHLRRKLGGAGRHIRTVGGVGYRIVPEFDATSAGEFA